MGKTSEHEALYLGCLGDSASYATKVLDRMSEHYSAAELLSVRATALFESVENGSCEVLLHLLQSTHFDSDAPV